MLNLVGYIALALIGGGLSGALVGSAFMLRGRDRELETRLIPIRDAVADLADRFDHFTKRERKRDRDAAAPVEVGGALTRTDRLREIRSRWRGGT